MEYKILKNEPMSGHTTFRVGGPADIYIIPESREGLLEAIRDYSVDGVRPLIIGKGSNLLVSDKGIRGAVIEIGEELGGVQLDGQRIYAGAGVMLSKLAKTAYENGLSGCEFASGIPGTVGGAVFMNAGAYGGEIKDIIEYADVIMDGRFQRLSCDELQFSYRHSRLMEEDIIITGACFRFEKGNPEEIVAKMNDFNQRRRDKQPLEYPSAGSTFKRPEGYFAGKLIMDSGLAGRSVGGAMVSPKHCGFIINHDNATAEDIYNLIQVVISEVEEKFGVKLETEVRLIGEF